AAAVRRGAAEAGVPAVRVGPGRVTVKWARDARQAVVTALTLAGFRPVAGSNQVRIPVTAGRDGVDAALRALSALTPAAGETSAWPMSPLRASGWVTSRSPMPICSTHGMPTTLAAAVSKTSVI